MEWHQLEVGRTGCRLICPSLGAAEPAGQKFARIVELPGTDGLSLRCALLQLWSGLLHGLLTAPVVESFGGNNRRSGSGSCSLK